MKREISKRRKIFAALTPLFVIIMINLPKERNQTQLSHPDETSAKKTIEKLKDAREKKDPTAQLEEDAERSLAQNPKQLEDLLASRRWQQEPLIDSFFLIKMAAVHSTDPIRHLAALLETQPVADLKSNDQLAILQTKALQEIQKRSLKELPNLGLLEKTALRLATQGQDLALVREAFRVSLQLTSDPRARYDKLIESRQDNELFALRDLRKLD